MLELERFLARPLQMAKELIKQQVEAELGAWANDLEFYCVEAQEINPMRLYVEMQLRLPASQQAVVPILVPDDWVDRLNARFASHSWPEDMFVLSCQNSRKGSQRVQQNLAETMRELSISESDAKLILPPPLLVDKTVSTTVEFVIGLSFGAWAAANRLFGQT